MNNTTHLNNGFPRQKLPLSQKTEEWKRACVDSICNQRRAKNFSTGRTSKHEKQVNYDLNNGKYNEDDFIHLTKPHGEGADYGDLPARMQNYNIIRPKIELLKGEEMKRPFFFMARGTGGEIINVKQKMKKDMLLKHFYANINSRLGLDIPDESSQPPMAPPAIQKYLESEYLDPREVTANQLLNFFVRHDELEQKFNRGWEDALIAAEEIYYISIQNGHPSVRVVNPINIEYELDDDNREIQKSTWIREERWLSPSTILDLWADQLKDHDVEQIDNGSIGYYNSHGMGDGLAFFENSPSLYEANTSSSRPTNGILVTTVCWRGMEKYKTLHYPDPQTGEMQETIVDEDFKLTMQMRNEGYSIEEGWRTIIYEGTRIGGDLYVDIKPMEYQLGIMPYVGYVYNSRNSKAVSLVDLCKQLQYSYMVAMWYIEMAMSRNKGPKFIMDISLMPKSNGMSPEKWQYYFDTFGIAYVQSTDENRGPGQRTSFNGITSVDMSAGNEIQQHIMFLNKLEEQISTITGVTPQREGQIMASETAANASSSKQASMAITESWFYWHNLVKKNVLSQMLEVAKVAYMDGATIPAVDEIYNSLIAVDGDTFGDSDYKTIVSNSTKDWAALQKMEQVAAQMAANGTLDMSNYAKLLLSQSITEYQHYIREAEKTRQENEQAAAKAEQDASAQEVQMKVAQEEKKMLNDNEQKELERQNKIQVATIGTLRGKDGPSDINANGVADGIEHARLALDISAQNAATVAEAGKQSMESAKLQASHQQAMKKMEMENEKLRLAADKLERETQMFIREQEQQDKVHADTQQDRDSKKQELQLKTRTEADKIRLAAEKVQADKELKEKELAQQVRENEKDRKLQIKLKEKEVAAKKEEIKMNIEATKQEKEAEVQVLTQEAKAHQVITNADIKKMGAEQQHMGAKESHAEHSLHIQKEKSKIKVKPKPKA